MTTKTRIPRRVVRLAEDYEYGDYAGFQLNFMDQLRGSILPSTRVFRGDELMWESNSLGCKGPELDDGRPVIGVFGDSVVQGGYMDSFVNFIRVGPCQPLNGGVEGSNIAITVDRFLEINAKVPMVAALVHSGWHNLVYGDNRESVWRENLDRVRGPPVIAHFRLSADFHPDMLATGYAHLMRDGYQQWTPEAVTPEGAADFKRQLDRFNSFIESYCAETGRLLIDLDPVLAPRSAAEVSTHFFDLIHPRASSYEAIGAAISAQIAAAVSPLVTGSQLNAWSPSFKAPAAVAKPVAESHPADDIGRNYPLW